MATIRVYPGGTSGGFAPDPSTAKPGKRGQVRGWTMGQARRNIAFLWSINTADLTGQGWACTFTVGTTPESASEWTNARNQLLDRARYMGMTRFHWVTEWTAKGRPHTHAALYVPGDRVDVTLALAWMDIAKAHGWDVNWKGQHVVPITGPDGWLQYVAKHASRGVAHYQRDGAPEGWQTTGRLWGKGGDWPVEEPEEVELGTAQFKLFRSLMWDWMLADMVARKVPAELVAKTRARWENPEHGEAHGVSGWIPGEVAYSMALAAKEAVAHEMAWEN